MKPITNRPKTTPRISRAWNQGGGAPFRSVPSCSHPEQRVNWIRERAGVLKICNNYSVFIYSPNTGLLRVFLPLSDGSLEHGPSV